MATNRIGGTIQLTKGGLVLSPKGNFTYRSNSKKKEGLVGANQVEGYVEKPLVPFIEGEITDRAGLNTRDLFDTEDETITLLLANGKTFVLEHAWFAGEGDTGTDEGNIAVRFEGLSGEEV